MKIFFDVDGVIVHGWNAEAGRHGSWDERLEEDLGIGREALQRALFRPGPGESESPMGACLRGARDLKEVLARILPGLGHRGSVEGFLDYWFRRDAYLDREVLEVAARIKACEGTALYLATGQEHHRAAYLWNALGLSQRFDAIYYSAGLGAPKDSPDFFAGINRELAIRPDERPLFFDDREKIVARARAAGWDARLFRSVEDLLQNERLARLLDGRGE